jgi:hypothetical protein
VPIRHNIAVLAAVAALTLLGPGRPAPARAAEPPVKYVGPTQILFLDADSVYWLRSAEWNSAYVRNQEKVLLHSLRMTYWRTHLPSDMRRVFDALGYPVCRVIHTPVGHVEEWWTYRLLDPPLRFRDGELLDSDRFEALRSR